MALIDLTTLDEAGFEALYKARIEPLFLGTEAERLATMQVFQQRLWIGLSLAAAAGVAVFVGLREPWPALIGTGVLGLVAYGFAQHPLSKLGARLKGQTLGALAEAIGAQYQGGVTPPGVVARCRTLGLLPHADREGYEDLFYGERHGCSFDMFEGLMENEHRDKDGHSSWVTVFQGQIIRIGFPRAFEGVTVVRRDAGIFNGLVGFGSKLEKVQFADPAFERKFEVYSTDQVEARVLVHPVFAERLLALEQLFDGRRLRCGFQDGDLLIAVEGKNRFEIGSMMKPLTDPARAKAIVEDLSAVLRVMDAVVTTERATLLRQAAARDAGARPSE